MGRQTRQARRAQERRQAHSAARKTRGATPNWSVFGPIAAIAVAVLAFVIYLISQNGGASNASSSGGGPRAGGIGCGSNTMSVTYHVHAHIAIFNKGKPQLIGQDFGHYYSGDCLYWMHAHDTTGIIHIEAPQTVTPTLQEWYDVQKLTLAKSAQISLTPPAGEQRKVWVNMKPYTGDPYNIKLFQHTDVTVEFGPPWVAPKRFNFAAYQV